jgi:hypothetical protein
MTIFGKNHKEKMWGGGKGEKEFFTGIYASKNPFISVPFGGILNENWCKKCSRDIIKITNAITNI